MATVINGWDFVKAFEDLGVITEQTPTTQILEIRYAPTRIEVVVAKLDEQGHKYKNPDNPSEIATETHSYDVIWNKDADEEG